MANDAGGPQGPIQARNYDVFLSYAHVDADADVANAQQIAEWLDELGYQVWWDRKLIAGQKWPRELKEKIERSTRVIVLWSPRAALSEWVGFETKLADMDDKLVPLIIDPHPTPKTWSATHQVAVANFEQQKGEILKVLRLPPPQPKGGDTGMRDDARVSIAALPTGAGRLIGRDIELTRLNAAWASTEQGAPAARKTNIVVLHAIGGAGKTALMRRFVDDLANAGFPGAHKVFGWSAYSQGSGEDRNVDADKFLNDALRHFGHDVDAKPIRDPLEKGRTLARLVKARRNLLVLDGLEPLQSPPGVNRGFLKDRGVAALVKELAAENKGLVVITSRQELPELGSTQPPSVINSALEALNPKEGAQLLRELGVWGTQTALEAAAKEVEGHALSLSLLGTYLDTVHAGDVRQRGNFHFADAVAGAAREGDRKARRAQHVMAKYVERFAELRDTAGGGETEIAILRMVGLFDRPAPKEALDALLAEPAIPGLTGALHGISSHERGSRWAWAVRRLRALKLLNSEDERDPGALDAHPVVREHFAAELKAAAPGAYAAAHSRLYDFYRYQGLPAEFRTPEAYGLLAYKAHHPEGPIADRAKQAAAGELSAENAPNVPPSLWKADPDRMRVAATVLGTPAFDAALKTFLPEGEVRMQTCFAAIAHGCAAGWYDKAFAEVYLPRVRWGNADFATKKLGLYGAELSAVAQFFDVPFATPSPRLSPEQQALVLNLAGFRLRALGRLAEAVEPMRACMDLFKEWAPPTKYSWRQAAINASNLSELLLTLGRVAEAERAGADSATYADRSGDAFQQMSKRTTHADPLHQAGKVDRAADLFAEAERMQAERQPGLPRLYSLQGYQYCDLLLAQGKAAEVGERYDYLVSVRLEDDSLLDHALEALLAGRAYAAMAQGTCGVPSPLVREGQGAGYSRTTAVGVPPTPIPSPQGGGETHPGLATHHLDEAVAKLIEANSEDDVPRGFIARAGYRRWIYATTGKETHLTGADQDLKDAEEIARRDEPNGGAMRLFLTDIALERCRLNLAQIARASGPAPAGPAKSQGIFGRLFGAPSPAVAKSPSPPDPELLRLAEAHWKQAADLVKETGYHRRDGELAELRNQLDGLGRLAS